MIKLEDRLTIFNNRLKDCHPINYEHCFNDLMFFITQNQEIRLILEQLELKVSYSSIESLKRIVDEVELLLKDPQGVILNDISFSTHFHRLYFYWTLLKKLFVSKTIVVDKFFGRLLIDNDLDKESKQEVGRRLFVEPLANYIKDKLEVYSDVLNLLIKYKKSKEWFYREQFFSMFNEVDKKKREYFLDMDLRCFLFENGLENPFSKTDTPVGIPDVFANVESEDPLVVEVKYLSKEKGYGSKKIVEGFTQIVKYADAFNAPVGYLVVFNTDEKNYEVSFEGAKSFPAYYEYNGKRFYVIVININPFGKTASAIKKIEYTDFTKEDLFEKK